MIKYQETQVMEQSLVWLDVMCCKVLFVYE